MVSLFCRHNRFTADCPICSRGTVLDSPRPGAGRSGDRAQSGARAADAGRSAARSSGSASKTNSRGAATYRGPYASAGPYEREGETYEVRLERVPGGLRLAEWSAGELRPRAPVLAAADVARLMQRAVDGRALGPAEHQELVRALGTRADTASAPAGGEEVDGGAAAHGASPGRSGELREELRVEQIEEGRLRIARWVLRPGTGWDLLDAPTMLPARRYAEALADAARQGLLSV